MVSLVNAVDTRLAICREVGGWGGIPPNPMFRVMRVTSESLTAGASTVSSAELRPDRNVSDLTVVSVGASGGFNFELSYGTFDDIIEAVMFGNWSGNALTNGPTLNQKSFTIEKRFDMGGGQFEYFRYLGMVPNSLTLDMGVDAIITGSVEFIGRCEEASSMAIFSATYADATTNPVLNATRDFAMFSLGGDVENYVQKLTMNITNNLRQQRAVAHVSPIGIGSGNFEVTGSIDVYFKNRVIYDKFLNNEGVSLTFIVGSQGGQQYRFTLPNVKFSSGSINAENQGADLIVNMNYQALFSQQIGGTIRIERAVGSPPPPVFPTGVTLDVSTLSLSVGNTGTIIATVQPIDATTKTVNWTTSDALIASVDDFGGVTGVAAGTAVITATTAIGDFSATCDVTVS